MIDDVQSASDLQFALSAARAENKALRDALRNATEHGPDLRIRPLVEAHDLAADGCIAVRLVADGIVFADKIEVIGTVHGWMMPDIGGGDFNG